MPLTVACRTRAASRSGSRTRAQVARPFPDHPPGTRASLASRGRSSSCTRYNGRSPPCSLDPGCSPSLFSPSPLIQNRCSQAACTERSARTTDEGTWRLPPSSCLDRGMATFVLAPRAEALLGLGELVAAARRPRRASASASSRSACERALGLLRGSRSASRRLGCEPARLGAQRGRDALAGGSPDLVAPAAPRASPPRAARSRPPASRRSAGRARAASRASGVDGRGTQRLAESLSSSAEVARSPNRLRAAAEQRADQHPARPPPPRPPRRLRLAGRARAAASCAAARPPRAARPSASARRAASRFADHATTLGFFSAAHLRGSVGLVRLAQTLDARSLRAFVNSSSGRSYSASSSLLEIGNGCERRVPSEAASRRRRSASSLRASRTRLVAAADAEVHLDEQRGRAARTGCERRGGARVGLERPDAPRSARAAASIGDVRAGLGDAKRSVGGVLRARGRA